MDLIELKRMALRVRFVNLKRSTSNLGHVIGSQNKQAHIYLPSWWSVDDDKLDLYWQITTDWSPNNCRSIRQLDRLSWNLLGLEPLFSRIVPVNLGSGLSVNQCMLVYNPETADRAVITRNWDRAHRWLTLTFQLAGILQTAQQLQQLSEASRGLMR